ncbi:MAG: hypothetical protein Q7L55_06150 [Actinomycetota bacterium]|nr:hypothetical protein [Actinomycetota bacterium]
MSNYRPPANRIHRGFFYLDDETVINSLSAVESGKIDEVAARVNSAREGGFGGGLGFSGVSLEASKKSSSEFEEEMVRTRTRFSVFELWYQTLKEGKALGSFDGWGPDALLNVASGDTVEFRAHLEIAPIQTLFRLFLWYVSKAKEQGHVMSAQGAELKSLKENERVIRMFLGDGEDDQVVVIATPNGEAGPKVAMPIKTRWLIGRFGQLGGEYSIVAQVDRIVPESQEIPALRLTHDLAATSLEMTLLKEAIENFKEPAESMGITITDDDAAIAGPLLWLEPIALYR